VRSAGGVADDVGDDFHAFVNGAGELVEGAHQFLVSAVGGSFPLFGVLEVSGGAVGELVEGTFVHAPMVTDTCVNGKPVQ
jgi:hypothetical protein